MAYGDRELAGRIARYLAFVGQHARSRSPQAHLAHTQSFGVLEIRINGIAVGEFGQLAMCASELGVRTIFGAGDEAFTKEAADLLPGIETVSQVGSQSRMRLGLAGSS